MLNNFLRGYGYGGGSFPLQAPVAGPPAAPFRPAIAGTAMMPALSHHPMLPPAGVGPGYMSSEYQGPEDLSFVSGGMPAPLRAMSEAEGTHLAKAGQYGYDSPYDVPLGYGQFGDAPSKPLSDMTLREAYDYGRTIWRDHGKSIGSTRHASSAKGAFQITNQTMKDFMKPAGLDWDDKFNAPNQNRLAYEIWKEQTLGAWAGFDNHPDQLAPYMVDLDSERCGVDGADPIAWQLRQAAADLTADLPMKVDENETLEFVTAEGRTLVYHYRLAVRDISDAELIETIRAEDVPRLCADPDTRDLFDTRGVTFRYSYVFPDSDAPVTIDIDAAACRGR